MFYGKSDIPYISVRDAARILRVDEDTIYNNLHDVPHIKVGNLIKIRCEWLFLEPPARVSHQVYEPHAHQMTLPFDVKPVRVWRNSRKPVMLDPYGTPRKER
jgi:hypothetical protein